jgi:hypothetical protein
VPVQHEDELVGFGSIIQSLLHPTGNPAGLKGPLSSAGQVRVKSFEQSWMEHLTSLRAWP